MIWNHLLLLAVLLALASAAPKLSDESVIIGGSSSQTPTTWIESIETLLLLPKTPSPQMSDSGIWSGLYTTSGDLIQTQALTLSDDTRKASDCNAKPGEWCIATSTTTCGDEGCSQQSGKFTAVPPDTAVTIRYTYNPDGRIDQTVLVNGQVLSTRSDYVTGKPLLWETQTVCGDNCKDTIPAHSYTHTNITLLFSDPKFGNTLVEMGNTTRTSGAGSTDGGKSWNIDWIHIGEWKMDG